MESRTAVLLDELLKAPRADLEEAFRRLGAALLEPAPADARPLGPPPMSAEDLAELQRRLDAIDDTLSPDELIARVEELMDREAAGPAGGR